MARLKFAFCVLFLLVCSSVKGRDDDLRQPKGFVLANNYFGFNLFGKLSDQNGQSAQPGNIFFSPYSVATALAMLQQGAAGDTSKQLESVLGFQLAKLNATDKQTLAQQIQQSERAMFSSDAPAAATEVATATISVPSNSSKYILKSGNALVANQQFPIRDSYKQTLKDYFQAETFSLDFGQDPTAAMNLINQWCSARTNGKIDKLLSEPPSRATQLALINAVYFKGSWKNKFDVNKTQPDTFTGLNGQKYDNVQFMNIKDHYKVANLDELAADLVELQYDGGDLSMFAILPRDKNSDLKQIRMALNPWYIESSISRAYEMKIKLKLPKLDFKTDYDLVDSLKSLGITDAFNGNKVNLSELASAGNLAVDQVKHVATIEVNEEGSEATAATYIGIVLTASIQPREQLFAFDHPFVFFIRHNRNGQILFIGEVNRF